MTRHTQTQRLMLDDQVAAAIRDMGSGTTGAVRRQVCAAGLTLRRPSGVCRCRCGELSHRNYWEGRPDSTDIRMALRRLARRGLVMEVKTPQPNNHGGHVWIWLDDGPDA